MRRRFFPLTAALAVAIATVVPSSSAFAQDERKSIESLSGVHRFLGECLFGELQ